MPAVARPAAHFSSRINRFSGVASGVLGVWLAGFGVSVGFRGMDSIVGTAGHYKKRPDGSGCLRVSVAKLYVGRSAQRLGLRKGRS